jgi:hypothetical protein
MTPEERIEIVRELLAAVAADPNRLGTLAPEERLIVAVALDDVGMIQADGISDLMQAQDQLGPEWITAIRAATAVP